MVRSCACNLFNALFLFILSTYILSTIRSPLYGPPPPTKEVRIIELTLYWVKDRFHFPSFRSCPKIFATFIHSLPLALLVYVYVPSVGHPGHLAIALFVDCPSSHTPGKGPPGVQSQATAPSRHRDVGQSKSSHRRKSASTSISPFHHVPCGSSFETSPLARNPGARIDTSTLLCNPLPFADDHAGDPVDPGHFCVSITSVSRSSSVLICLF